MELAPGSPLSEELCQNLASLNCTLRLAYQQTAWTWIAQQISREPKNSHAAWPVHIAALRQCLSSANKIDSHTELIGYTEYYRAVHMRNRHHSVLVSSGRAERLKTQLFYTIKNSVSWATASCFLWFSKKRKKRCCSCKCKPVTTQFIGMALHTSLLWAIHVSSTEHTTLPMLGVSHCVQLTCTTLPISGG